MDPNIIAAGMFSVGVLVGILLGAQIAYRSPEELKETERVINYGVVGEPGDIFK